MKTTCSFLLCLLFILSPWGGQKGAAQPTITWQNLPQPGYTYITITDTMPAISLGTAGQVFQTWDFTTLDSHYPSVPTFDLTSKTPYAADFPASNIYTYGPAAMFGGFFGGTPVSSVGYAKGHMFWKTDVTGYWITGFRADSGEWAGLNVYENPMELLIGTPCSYGDVDNNTARWELPVSDTSPNYETFYVNHVVKTLTADAWGWLQIPNGISDTILRVHEYLVRTDSVYLKNGTIILGSYEIYRDTLNNYLYLSPNYNYPLAHVHADKNNNVKTVEYYLTGMVLSAGQEPLVEYEWNIYPNPSNGNSLMVHFSGELSINREIIMRIFTLSGKEISASVMRNGKAIVNKNIFPSDGIYLINLFDGEKKIFNGKMVVEN